MTEEEEKFMSETLDEWAMLDDPNTTLGEIEKLHQDEVEASK